MQVKRGSFFLLAALLLACKPAAQATTQSASDAPTTPEVKSGASEKISGDEVINGIAIMPGVERLSYIAPAYIKIRSKYTSCVQASQGAIAARMDCAEDEFQFQDARLNRAYLELLESHNKASGPNYSLDVQGVVSAQKAWIAFSNLDCSTRSQRFGSTRAPTTEIECRMENAALRAQQLEDWKVILDNS